MATHRPSLLVAWRPALARRGAAATASALFVFLALFLFFATRANNDVRLYARYARTWAVAGLAGLYQAHDVEYPHVAVGLMIAARQLGDLVPPGLASRRARGPRPWAPDAGSFQAAYGRLLFVTHCVAFVLLLSLMNRCCPGETGREKLERVAAFLLAGFFLRDYLYNELDLVLCAMMTAAFLLLLSRRHYAWSYAVLALAIGLKVAPVILVPLWALASLPLAVLARPLRARQLLRLSAAVLRRLALLGLLLLATFLPFYLAAGARSLAFLGYHAKRGIEFESTYAALLGALHVVGYPIEVRPAYGSCDILSPLSPFLTRLAPFLVGGLLLAAGCLLLTSLVRWARAAEPGAEAVGRAFRGEALSYTLLFLLLFITANKVFSPQYVLWVLTLAPAVPFKSWARRAFLGGFVALCAVTWLICPRYLSAVLRPTPFGTALLVARSLLLFGLIAGLVWALIRRYRFGPASPCPDV